jgi:hypothetical protein
MSNHRDDSRYGGDDRWREREERGSFDRDRDYGRGGSGRDEPWGGGDWRTSSDGRGSSDGRPGSHRESGGRDDDRGFLERAGHELRSFFGSDDGRSGREGDSRHRAQERGMGTRRDNGFTDDQGPGTLGGGGFGGGWGNQMGESWNRERPGARDPRDEGFGGGAGRPEAAREGWFTDSVGGERGRRMGGPGGHDHQPEQGRGRPQGDSSYFGMGGGGWDQPASRGAPPSTARDHQHGLDPHYSEWRSRQMEELDRDYEEYRREHQSKFDEEFGNWRSKRQGQRQMLGRVTEHMEVVGSDGEHVGTVDKVRGDRIILTRTDPAAGGVHHSVPCTWVESVDQKVTLDRTAAKAIGDWRNEDGTRALFEKEGSGSEGPHALNRSFSGTYDDKD